MEQNITLSEENNTDKASFIKLNSTLCFLMTKFNSHQCPQLSQFIVKHIALLVEHPDVASSANCQTLYLQLLQQWQSITTSLLEQRKSFALNKKHIH
ncbi:MAG: hypothetical protein Q7U23_03135 [Methylococcales bacterium]|nr:hypothetical protein [Methylococcales bacterium]